MGTFAIASRFHRQLCKCKSGSYPAKKSVGHATFVFPSLFISDAIRMSAPDVMTRSPVVSLRELFDELPQSLNNNVELQEFFRLLDAKG